jgi:hypothetical protein
MTSNDPTIISDDVELKELLKLNEQIGEYSLNVYKPKQLPLRYGSYHFLFDYNPPSR